MNAEQTAKMNRLKYEVKVLKEKVRKLEEYGNALVAHVYNYRTQRTWSESAYHDLIQTISDWDKAKGKE